MNHELPPLEVVTITLNPAIDHTVAIPHFTAGSVNRAPAALSYPGGKGVNVASALADFGHGAAVTGFLGRENSSSFEALFERKRIADLFIRITGQTRVGIKIADPALGQTTDINFPGLAPSAEDMAGLWSRVVGLRAQWFALAGSLPPGVEPSFYRDLITALKAQGHKVLLDASGEALRLGANAGPTIIKPNIHELEELLGRALPTEADAIAAAQGLVARGVGMAVVSMGKAGACFVTAERAIVARPPEVRAQSSVGAGYAMAAGILAAQLRGLDLRETAKLATAFALESLGRIENGLASPGAIPELMRQVAVKEISAKRPAVA